MERVTNGSIVGFEYSTPWGEDAEGISGSGSASGMGHPFWFATDGGGGGGFSVATDDGAGGGPVTRVVGSGAVGATVGMIDPDGILLLSTAVSGMGGTSSTGGELGGSTPTYIATMCIMSVILLVGITGNVLVPIVIAHSKDLRNSTNIFLVNLALADLLVILICLPTGFVELHSTPGVWYLGETMCKSLSPVH